MVVVALSRSNFISLGQSSDLFGEVAPWLAVLLVVVLVGAVVIFAIRRRVFGDESSSAGGFTLHDLRQLHASGKMSDEEFERAKEQMIGRVRAARESPDEGDLTSGLRAKESSGGDRSSDSRPQSE